MADGRCGAPGTGREGAEPHRWWASWPCSESGVPGTRSRDPGVGHLAQAVLDILPHPAERLHERFDVEGLVGSGVQEAHQARPERRLHQRLETSLQIAELRALGGKG